MSSPSPAPPQYSADGRYWWNGQTWVSVPPATSSADGRWRWTGTTWEPTAQPQPPALGTFPAPKAAAIRPPKKKRKPIVLPIVLIVAAVAAGWWAYPRLFPPSPFLSSQGAADQLYAGLNQEVDLSDAALLPLFHDSSAPAVPARIYVPPQPAGGSIVSVVSAGVPIVLTDHVDVSTQGKIPSDFETYAENAIAAGISQFDAFYKDRTFNFAAQTSSSHFGLLITTDITAFAALDRTTVFRSGFMQPCPNNAANRNSCIPRVMLYFDPRQWTAGEYAPMTRPRIEHEVFHVAHFYILRSLGHAELFSIPGYYWQTEGFATYTQRAIPDPETYLSFTTSLLSQGFFTWPTVTDKSYEDSYAAAPFLDEMVFRSGDRPGLILKWLSSAQPNYPSSLSLMDTFSPGPKPGTINISAFQRLWLGSMVDYYFPGLLPNPDPRTGTAAPILPKPAGAITKDNLPVSTRAAVPAVAVKTLVVGIGSLPDETEVTNLKISLGSDLPLNERAIVMLVKGNADDNLAFCDQRLTGDIASGVKGCIAAHVRLLGVVAHGGNTSFKLPLAALKSFSPDATQAAVVVFVAHTIAEVSDADLAPMHVTLTVAKDLPSDDQATLDMTASGTGDVPLAVHLTADKFVANSLPGEEASCHLHAGGWLNLFWQPSDGGQDYLVNVQIFGYHGPGTYISGYDNHPPSSTFGLTRLDAQQTGWAGALGKGSVTVNDDGQTGSFTSALYWGVDPQLRQGTMTGTFACGIPIS